MKLFLFNISFLCKIILLSALFVQANASNVSVWLINKKESEQWAPTGRLILANYKRCNAHLVGIDKIVTSAKCLSNRFGKRLDDSEIFPAKFQAGFYDGYGDDPYKYQVSVLKIDAFGSPNTFSDYAILRLRGAIGHKAGWFKILNTDLLDLSSPRWKQKIILAGNASYTTMVLARNCSIFGKYNSTWGEYFYNHDCIRLASDGRPNVYTGSGLFVMRGGEPYLVGIYTSQSIGGTRRWDPDTGNFVSNEVRGELTHVSIFKDLL